MSFKKKTTYMKQETEYESPDGDLYDCAVVKHGDRCYVQWAKQGEGESTITIDGKMLEGLYEQYCEMTGKRNSAIRLGPGGRPRQGLRVPNVVDHRGEPQGVEIHRSVKDSMRNYDDSVAPVESFSPEWDTPEGRAAVRYGVDVNAQEQVGETPEEWALQPGENMPGWKQDAMSRQNMPKPQFKQRGAVGNKFKRVGASEIM